MKKHVEASGARHTGDAAKRERSQDRRTLERPQVSLFGNGESASRPDLTRPRWSVVKLAVVKRDGGSTPEIRSSSIFMTIRRSYRIYVCRGKG
jgi:hypothetical protein